MTREELTQKIRSRKRAMQRSWKDITSDISDGSPIVAVALIEEEFGDGIMSAIDFDMTMEREPDPKGDRVKIALTGKSLPYKRY
jgi:cyanate lyase